MSEQEKICPKCKEVKPLDQFHMTAKGTIRSKCISCTPEPRPLSEEQLAINRQRKKDNKEANDARRKEYLQENQERLRISRREYYRKYYAKNKERLNQYQKEYKDNNIRVKFRDRLRTRILYFIDKDGSTEDYLGVTMEFVKEWLEFNFTDDMSWENYGKVWNIDHTIPCIAFDMEDDAKVRMCFDWKNLMPKYVISNLKKRSKVLPYLILFQETRVRAFLKEKTIEDTDLETYFKGYSGFLKKHFDRPMGKAK